MAMHPPRKRRDLIETGGDIICVPTLSRATMLLPHLDLAQLRTVCAAISARAGIVDERAALPLDDIKSLNDAELLHFVRQVDCDGRPVGSDRLGQVLTAIGAASLTVGRLYEGNVNAVQLIGHYGGASSHVLLAEEVREARLLGVWNAEREGGPRLTPCSGGWRLTGRKVHCSGAGHIRRPIVTARDPDDAVQMVLPDMTAFGVRIDVSVWRATGMRGTATATIEFDDVFVPDTARLGAPGDYYRSPLFSGGAWRVLAVQLGGLQNILRLHARRLVGSGRADDPVFRARFSGAAADYECARLLVEEAGRRAENDALDPSAIDAYVNQARGQFERFALAGIDAARRNVGLSSFVAPDPLDRCIRDLETYLRQPFVDASRDSAARWLLDGGSFGS